MKYFYIFFFHFLIVIVLVVIYVMLYYIEIHPHFAIQQLGMSSQSIVDNGLHLLNFLNHLRSILCSMFYNAISITILIRFRLLLQCPYNQEYVIGQNSADINRPYKRPLSKFLKLSIDRQTASG